MLSTLDSCLVNPPKCQLTFNAPHSVIYHNMELFIITAARTSNRTWGAASFKKQRDLKPHL
jgi:hypothetical protein